MSNPYLPAFTKLLKDLDDKIEDESKEVQTLVDSGDLTQAGIRAALAITTIQHYVNGLRRGLGLVDGIDE